MAYYKLKLGNSEFEHGTATNDKRGIVKGAFSNHDIATVNGEYKDFAGIQVVNERTCAEGRFYGVEVDAEGKMYVNVPWENTVSEDVDLSEYPKTIEVISLIGSSNAASATYATHLGDSTNSYTYATLTSILEENERVAAEAYSDLDNRLNSLVIPDPVVVENKSVMLTPGGITTIATINGTDITVGMPNVSSGDGEMAADGVLSNIIADEGGNGEVVFDRTILGPISANLSHNHDTLEVGSDGFYITDSYDNVVAKIDNAGIDSIDLKVNGQSVNNLINVTYSELKSLRNNGQLYPGRQYRITDYVTTTSQENTQSAGHQLDIIVTADNESTLNEEARAIQHKGDTYFANGDLAAWEIKYCLDNDTNRFAWADTSSGKGVIYYMKDEYGNECPYDFKNIMFIRYQLEAPTTSGYSEQWITILAANISEQFSNNQLSYIWGGLNNSDRNWVSKINNRCYSPNTGTTKAFYTFSNIINDVVSDKSITKYCYNNVIKEYISSQKLRLNNNVFFNTSDTSLCNSNSFGNECNSNSFGNECYDNSFKDGCNNNSFGSGCFYNSFENFCFDNSFGNVCNNNSFGNSCNSNSFGNSCRYNSFGNYCYRNSFGNYCNSNSFGNGCDHNSFGNYCRYNSFGNYCEYNSFRTSASTSGTLKAYCYYNHFDDGCSFNVIWNNETTSSSVQLKNININRGVSGTSSSYNYINVDTLNSEQEINVNQVDGIVSIGEILSIKYESLVALRDNGQLIPGRQYRITDYITSTSQDSTISANHPFDIIVTADSESTLNEKARAIQHEGDTYFANQKLNAWELWYCLDNDTNRFAWANASEEDEDIAGASGTPNVINQSSFSTTTITSAGQTLTFDKPISYIIWNGKKFEFSQLLTSTGAQISQQTPVFARANSPTTLLIFVLAGSSVSTSYFDAYPIEVYTVEYTTRYAGKGVIYRMIDENHNDCPYDFKNIMFKHPNDTITYPAWYYTFTLLNSGAVSDYSFYGNRCKNNTIKEHYVDDIIAKLNQIVFINTGVHKCCNNSFGNYCYRNSFGNYCNSNSFGNGCSFNSFGDDCYRNSFGNYCNSNSFGNGCDHNSFGHYCNSNSFGHQCYDNSFGHACRNNSFGHGCRNNSFGNECNSNSFGNECYDNSFGSGCSNKTFENDIFNVTHFSGKVYASGGFHEE